MGVVAMELASSFVAHGESCLTRAAYVYCDKCGTFRIKKIHGVSQVGTIFIGIFIFAILIYIKVPIFLLFPIVVAICVVIAGLWGLPEYKCLKCGEITTIKYNTRNYPSDKSIVDIPEELIEKLYIEYWSDDGDLEGHLKPPRS
jgi:hypothetical protein